MLISDVVSPTEGADPQAALGPERHEGRPRVDHVRGHVPRAGDGAVHAVLHGAPRPPVPPALQQRAFHHTDQDCQG